MAPAEGKTEAVRPGSWLRFDADLGRPLVLPSARLHVLFLAGGVVYDPSFSPVLPVGAFSLA